MSGAPAAQSLEGYADVLRAATAALHEAGIDHLVFGGIATRALGRQHEIRTDEDIDVFVRPPDAGAALDALTRGGFVTQAVDDTWIHRAKRAGVTVDVIFKAAGRVYLDDEMVERGAVTPVMGIPVRLIPREDLAVIKALLHDEDRAFDWFDALALIDDVDVDWRYLASRAAAYGAQRVLSLLLFARTVGVTVPAEVIDDLRRRAVEDAPPSS